MAKIKRFYLLIAALIYTRTYNLGAATVDCSTISGLSDAQSCYTDWKTRYEGGYLTYGAYKNSGLFDGDYHTCYGWSDPAENGDEIDEMAHCVELYYDELAGACCEVSGAAANGYCTNILLGYDTCYEESGDDTEPPSGCVAKSCADGYGLDPVEGCMRCDGGQYVKNNQTVESETGECWVGPICADCLGYRAPDGTYIDAYTSSNDEPGSTIHSCYISKDDTWTFSDDMGKGYQSFAYNCFYGS